LALATEDNFQNTNKVLRKGVAAKHPPPMPNEQKKREKKEKMVHDSTYRLPIREIKIVERSTEH